MDINRRTFLKTAGYAALVSTAAYFPSYNHLRHQNSVEKTLLIGIDGLRPDALLKAKTPHIDSLVDEGAYSFEALAGKHTLSYPGWSNIFTGVWENKHGVFANPGEGIQISANFQKYPSFFTRAKEYQPELNTVSLVGWSTINDVIINDIIVKSLNQNIYHSYHENKEKADLYIAGDAAAILAQGDPDIMFVYFLNVDSAGHNYGFSAEVPEYLEAIQQTDAYVGRIIDAVRLRPRYNRENWLTMLISDHGGKGKSHDGIEEARIIPFIMQGPSVKKGEIIPAPTQVDVAPTILKHLGIPIKSEWGLDGKVVWLQ